MSPHLLALVNAHAELRRIHAHALSTLTPLGVEVLPLGEPLDLTPLSLHTHDPLALQAWLDTLSAPTPPAHLARDYAAAGAIGLLGGLLSAALTGVPAQALGGSLLSALGAPSTHSARSAKVSFDATLGAEYGATGNHRWNSLSHDPSLVGLLSGVRDVLLGTSTHIVDGGVVRVEVMNEGVARELAQGPLAEPGAWLIYRLLWAVGLVLRHWWSDVNTSLGLPTPFAFLLKTLECGEVDYKGMRLNLADFSYELYRDGLDLRRYIGDSVIVTVTQLALRAYLAWGAHDAGGGWGGAWRAFQRLDPHGERLLLTSLSVSASVNLAQLALLGNPLLINLPLWWTLCKTAVGYTWRAHIRESGSVEAQLTHLALERAQDLALSLSDAQGSLERLRRALTK
jgi:hypothetical protein